MVFEKKRALSAFVLFALTGLSALRVNAEQATFTLPFETRWGNVVLQPGQYTMAVPTSMSWPQIIAVSGPGGTAHIIANTEAAVSLAENSYLQFVNVDGTPVVREFRSGASGKLFTFMTPKSSAMPMVRKRNPEETSRVAVEIRR